MRIFGLSGFPEMRLTVSFRITYTLRPIWGAGADSKDFSFFRSTANRTTVIIREHFAAALGFLKHQGGIDRGLLS